MRLGLSGEKCARERPCNDDGCQIVARGNAERGVLESTSFWKLCTGVLYSPDTLVPGTLVPG
eukprot:3227063-Rhodomonas_salina.2